MVWSASSPRRAVALVVSLMLMLMWVPGLLINPTPAGAAGTHAGFEIDGDLAPSGGLDWNSAAVQPQPVETDNSPESTVYQTSSKEDHAVSTWTLGGAPPTKDDINNVYGYATNEVG